jgi:hypothetical protein
MKKKSFHILTMIIVVLASASCKKEYSASGGKKSAVKEDYNMRIDFKPMVDTLLLKLDSTYKNYFDEPYRISQFKFYVSQFDLINTDSNKVYNVNHDKYFLIDAADSTTWSAKLSVAPFRFNRIAFTIGVDSAKNVSGAQTGALDPAKGMFWTWNSGYIMAKLEGISSVSSLPNQKFEYHIGGFKGSENALRRPLLLFPFGQFSEIVPDKKSIITIQANANAWFYNPHDIKIEETPACTTPGVLAKSIAENYTKMFTVVDIKNY